MDDIVLASGIVIPRDALEWRFSTSGGPGGQHANRSATRVELLFDVAGSDAFDEPVKRRMLGRLEGRAPAGVVTVGADDTRSQAQNRRIAAERLAALLDRATAPPPPPRRPSRPTPAARERRLVAKRARSATKQLRKPPIEE